MHTKDVLAAFQEGEERLVFARYRDQPERTYHLLQGAVTDEVRALTREHLRCLIPDCPDPRLKVVKRSPRARDGFSHHAGQGGHGLETLFHQQAKALLASWVRGRWPDLHVAEERATAGRERTADVMVQWPNGTQVAFEFQYSPLTPDAWQRRHDSYRALGIVDVWLLGNNRSHLVRSRTGPPLADAGCQYLRLTPLQQAMLHAGVEPLWLNPIDGKIGTVEVYETVDPAWKIRLPRPTDDDGRVWPVPVSPLDPHAAFQATSLDDCDLTEAGFVVPRLHELAANLATVRTLNERRRLQAAEELRRTKEAQQAAAASRADRPPAEALGTPLRPPTTPLTPDQTAYRFVRQALPSIDPLQYWHPHAVILLRDHQPATPNQLRAALGAYAEGVTDTDLRHAIVDYTRGLKRP
jgi:hypothetical protein